MNLLLVDDEITMINILTDAVDWMTVGIERVFTAYNAMRAKEIVEKETINILVCDIEMPKESGLELIRWIREQKREISCIILTAYPDFNYAKDAISLDVDTYLLKPVVFEDLKNVVAKTIEKIQKRSRDNSYREYGEEVIANKNRAARVFMQELFYESIPVSEENIRREVERLNLGLDVTEKISLILFRARDEKDLKSKGKIVRFAFVNIAEELFKDIYVDCVEYAPVFMTKGYVERERLEAICREYQQVSGQYIKCELGAYVISDIMPVQLSTAFDLLLETSHYLLPDRNGIRYVKYEFSGQNAERTLTGEPGAVGGKGTGRTEVELAREYLQNHYQENITRKDIERHMHLNGDYLNRIYKSATGYTLMEYIQYVRIEKAKQLLRTTNDTISEICGKTGYDSPPYFAKIFKKQTGKTPSEYREGNG